MVLRASSTLAAVSLASAAAALAFWIVSFVSSAKKEISEVVRSREEAPLGHSRCMKKGVERISPATPEQTLLPAQHVLHRLELGQEPLLPRTEVSQLVPCCLQSAFNSCN